MLELIKQYASAKEALEKQAAQARATGYKILTVCHEEKGLYRYGLEIASGSHKLFFSGDVATEDIAIEEMLYMLIMGVNLIHNCVFLIEVRK